MSSDLAEWETKGIALEPSEDGWDDGSVHTLQVVDWEGKFYLFSASGRNGEGGSRQVGVAVADTREEPFATSSFNHVVA